MSDPADVGDGFSFGLQTYEAQRVEVPPNLSQAARSFAGLPVQTAPALGQFSARASNAAFDAN